MLVLNAEQIRRLAPMRRLIESLREAFRGQHVVPPRQVIALPGGAGERLLLTMGAFDLDGGGAVKLSTFFCDNPMRNLPTIQGAIVVFSDRGTPIALLDGTIVTRLRTGAASGLASSYLSRPDSAHLVLIGTGALAPFMALAHSAARPISRISVCGRHPERVASTIAAIRALLDHSVDVIAASSIKQAAATADIICCVTNSVNPVLCGSWLNPGAFIDLVGSFSPSKREADDDVLLRSRIFVDTLEGALSEAGDLLDPLKRGVIERTRIEGELADLVTGRATGRRNGDEIIVFKSVGTAIEDLAAAKLIVAAASSI